MPKRNLAWLAVILLAVAALWVLTRWNEFAPRSNNPQNQAAGDPWAGVRAFVSEHYVMALGEPQWDKLRDCGLRAYYAALPDGYSQYIAPDEVEDFKADQQGKFCGIGVELGTQERFATVATVLDASPAYGAGLMPRDRILKVDGHSTEGLTVLAASKLIRGQGQPDTAVELLVERPDEGTVRPLTLHRAQVVRRPIKGFRPDGAGGWSYLIGPKAPSVGYIRVCEFLTSDGESTIDSFDAALSRITNAGANKLIIDLRNNPGGQLDQAIQMVKRFLSGGVLIVEERGLHRGQKHSADDPTARAYDAAGHRWPIVVLVNGSTASAAEIVAGSLAFNSRAVLVGQRTFGKGTVQEIQPLSVGEGETALVKSTVAYLYLPYPPNGFPFDRTEPPADFATPWAGRPKPDPARIGGLKPTLEVALTPADQQAIWRCRRRLDQAAGGTGLAPLTQPQPDNTTQPAVRVTVTSVSVEQLAEELLKADPQLAAAVKLISTKEAYQKLLKKAPTTAAESGDEP